MGEIRGELLSEAAVAFKKRRPDIEKHAAAARELSRMLTSFAPDWIAETKGLVSAVPELTTACYLAWNTSESAEDAWTTPAATPAETNKTAGADPAASPESACLSATVTGASCVGCRAMLHINLEGSPHPLQLASRAASPGTLAYVASAAGGELGVSAFVNEAELAGCVQPGPVVRDTGSGLRPTLLLRAAAERALTVEQAAAKVGELQDKYGLATPDGRGTVFLFADGEGNTALLEATAKHRVFARQSEGLWTVESGFQLPDSPDGPKDRESPRRQRFRENLCLAPPAWPRFLAIARLRSSAGEPEANGICRSGTTGTFSAVLGGKAPAGRALVTLGPPDAVPGLAVFPGFGIPLPTLNGGVTAAAENLRLATTSEKRREALTDADEQLVRLLNSSLGTDEGPEELETLVKKSYAALLEFFDRVAEPEA